MNHAMAQDAMTIATVLAGLFFSVVFALLVEELIFGVLFRLFFPAGHAVESADPLPGQARANEGQLRAQR